MTDNVGWTATHAISVQVDNTAPIVLLLDPAPGSLISGDLEFSAWAEDAESGLVEIAMSSGGMTPSVINGSATYGTPVFSDMRTSIDAAPALDGAWTLTAWASDAGGSQPRLIRAPDRRRAGGDGHDVAIHLQLRYDSTHGRINDDCAHCPRHARAHELL